MQIHSAATGGGSILVRNSTFGIASHGGAAIIHADGTESVVIEDSVFHEEEAGGGGYGANTDLNSSGGSEIVSGSDTHANGVAVTGGGGSSKGLDTHAELAITGSRYGSPIGLDTHRGLAAGSMDGSENSNHMGNPRAIFAGPGVELSVTGSTFALGSAAAAEAADSVGGGGAVMCYGAVIRGCSFVVAGPCSEVGIYART